MLVYLQGGKSVVQILQSIQVCHVHTVHEALAVLDNLACSLQVGQSHE